MPCGRRKGVGSGLGLHKGGGNSYGDGKTMLGKQTFTMPCRDNRTQRGLWSPGPAEFPHHT